MTLAKLSVISGFIGVGASFHKLYLYHIVGILFFILFTFKYLKEAEFRESFKINKSFYFFFIYIGWYLLSSIWSDSTINSLKTSTYILIGSSLTFIISQIFNSKEKLQSLFKLLTTLYFIHIAICFLEIFTTFRMPISPASSLAHYFGREMDVQAVSRGVYSLSQPTSFYWGPNDTSFVTLLGLPFVLWSKKFWVFSIGLAAALIIPVFSSSRGVIVLTILTILAFIIFKLLESKRTNMKRILVIALITLVGTGTFGFLADELKKKEIKDSLTTFVDYSLDFVSLTKLAITFDNKIFSELKVKNERILFMSCALYVSKESRFKGIGAGSLQDKSCAIKEFSIELKSIHNYWVEIFVEVGGVFLIIYILWILNIFKLLYRKVKYASYPFAFSLILFVTGVPVLSRGIYFLPKYLLFGVILAYLSVNQEVRVNEEYVSKQ
jgi:hypothetical protein